jgi:hypothetical protein
VKLFGWATPEGWRQVRRPEQREKSSPELEPSADGGPKQGSEGDRVKTSLVCQIEAMARPLGRGLYRGLLKRVARVWNPGKSRTEQ